MRKRLSKTRRKRKSRRFEDELSHDYSDMRSATVNAKERLGAFYATGPVLSLNGRQQEEATKEQGKNVDSGHEKANAKNKVEPILPVHGQKETDHITVFTSSGPIRLRGRTDADFSYSYETRNVTTTAATGCRNCPDTSCVRCRGRLVIRYRVRTTVTLPSVSDFPDLTPCQQQRVRDAIDNVLAPHEQQHVSAFNTYRGTIDRQFDLTLCRSEFDDRIRSMAESEEAVRRSTVQAASDALDPFHFDVDIDCEDEPEEGG